MPGRTELGEYCTAVGRAEGAVVFFFLHRAAEKVIFILLLLDFVLYK